MDKAEVFMTNRLTYRKEINVNWKRNGQGSATVLSTFVEQCVAMKFRCRGAKTDTSGWRQVEGVIAERHISRKLNRKDLHGCRRDTGIPVRPGNNGHILSIKVRQIAGVTEADRMNIDPL